MNKIKKVTVTILIIITIILIGILALLIGSNISINDNKETKSNIVKQSKTNNSSQSIKDKLNNNDYYVLAYMKLDGLTLDKLLNGSKEWSNLDDGPRNPENTNYAFIKNKGQLCIGDNSQSNEGLTKLIKVNQDNVIIAHLEGENSSTPHYRYTYKDITYHKNDLINQFIHSQDDINKIQQITKNMKNNEVTATKQWNGKDNDNNIKNITPQQLGIILVMAKAPGILDESLCYEAGKEYNSIIATENDGSANFSYKREGNQVIFKQKDPNSLPPGGCVADEKIKTETIPISQLIDKYYSNSQQQSKVNNYVSKLQNN